MIKNKASSGCIIRVSRVFLDYPTRFFEFKDLIPLLDESDSNIERALIDLKKYGILKISRNRGRLKGDENPKSYYRISIKPIAFRNLFRLHLDAGEYQNLLNSKYTDHFIGRIGLKGVYNVIKDELKDERFKRIASSILFDHQATVAQYSDTENLVVEYQNIYKKRKSLSEAKLDSKLFGNNELINLIFEHPSRDYFLPEIKQFAYEIGFELVPIRSEHLDLLKKFDPIRTVPFYRSTLHREMKTLFSELQNRSLITRGLSLFMRLDNYLSPFTSFPVQAPDILLFHRPFHRIYDDFYLLDEDDLQRFEIRAMILYKNFSDILFEYFRNNLKTNPDELKQWIKQFIFYWNVAKTNFDLVWEYLNGLYIDEMGSGKFHVYLNGAILKVMDLETNESLPEIYDRKGMIDGEEYVVDTIGTPFIDELSVRGTEIDKHNPYTRLESCSSFFDISCPDFISYSRILSDIKSKFDKYGWDYDKIRMK